MRAGSVPEIRALTEEELRMRILFIGNSHTYYNDMPALAAAELEKQGIRCEVTMIAHGGWFLEQHVQEPDVKFNIRYGHYDYVVLQEHAHPFGPEEKFYGAVRCLTEWIRQASARPVLYMTWAKKGEEGAQPRMSAAYREIARKTGALLAPVGELWWEYRRSHPKIEMYDGDGAHASAAGSAFAAKEICSTILKDLQRDRKDGE